MGRWVSESSETLLELLTHSRDAAAHCVVDMLTVAVVEQPTHLIPALFRILRHGDAMARRNALDVLCALPALVTQHTDTRTTEAAAAATRVPLPPSSLPYSSQSSSSPTAHRRVLQLLATHLMMQLHDGELQLRMQAAALFAKVHPEDVITPLLHLYLQPRAWEGEACAGGGGGSGGDSVCADAATQRSTVQTALETVVSAHAAEGARVLCLIWRLAETVWAALPVTNTATSGGATSSEPPPPPETDEDGVADRWMRPVPHAPGDILPHAMLYAHAPLQHALGGEFDPVTASQEEKKAGETQLADDAAHTGCGAPARERLTRLVQRLGECWVRAVSQWSCERHVMPLLCHVRTGGGSEQQEQEQDQEQATDEKELPSSTHSDARRGWRVRCLTHVLQCASAPLPLGSDRPDDAEASVRSTRRRRVGQARRVCAEALWRTFFAPPASKGTTDESAPSEAADSDEWCVCREARYAGSPWLRRVLSPLAPSAQTVREGVVFEVVLPLLCLRACVGWIEPQTCHDNTEEKENDVEGDEKCLSLDAAPPARMWDVLWHAALCHSTTAPLFRLAPELIRVVLELICDVSPAVLFQRIDVVTGGIYTIKPHDDRNKVKDEERRMSDARSLHDGAAVCAMHKCRPPPSLPLRLVFFALCHYLSTMPALLSRRGVRGCTDGCLVDACADRSGCDVRRDGNEAESEVRRVLQRRCIDALGLIESNVLPWLAREDTEEKAEYEERRTASSLASEPTEMTMQKMSRLGVDALALMTMHRLCDDAPVKEWPAHETGDVRVTEEKEDDSPSHDTAGCVGDVSRVTSELSGELWQRHGDVVLLPLRSLADMYRTGTTANITSSSSSTQSNDTITNSVREDGASTWSTALGEGARTSACADPLVRFQLCVHVHHRVLGMMRRTGSSDVSVTHSHRGEVVDVGRLWLCWFQRHLPALMELANAACAFSRRGAAAAAAASLTRTGERVACECCELVFHAVMCAARPIASASLLQRLPYVDKVALIQFALGSARYGACVELQKVGVRLLSALVAAAPEMWGESAGGGPGGGVSLVMRRASESESEATGREDMVEGMLREASYVLRSVAHVHPDAATRTLAERVLVALMAQETDA